MKRTDSYCFSFWDFLAQHDMAIAMRDFYVTNKHERKARFWGRIASQLIEDAAHARGSPRIPD